MSKFDFLAFTFVARCKFVATGLNKNRIFCQFERNRHATSLYPSSWRQYEDRSNIHYVYIDIFLHVFSFLFEKRRRFDSYMYIQKDFTRRQSKTIIEFSRAESIYIYACID